MKRLVALVAIAGALVLTACEDPRPAEPEVMDAPMEEPVAPSADEIQAPVAAPETTDTPPDATTSPSDKRTSEESVRPESETLFY